MVRHKLAIVIPVWNEEKTIYSVIKAVSDFGQVIVIDDFSNDNTLIEALKTNAIVYSLKKNSGYEAAIEKGFEIAIKNKFNFVITMDGDGQHDPNTVKNIYEILKNNVDLVRATRDSLQRIGEYLFAFYTKIRWSINDPLSGLKGYNISLYSTLGHFDSYRSIGTEILIYALKNNYKVSQIKTKTRKREDLSRFGGSFKANIKILRALGLSFFKKNYNDL